MPNILNHSTMQHRRVQFIDSMGIWVLSLKLILRKDLHDVPKIPNILLAFLYWNIVCNDHKSIIFQILPPFLFLLKRNSIALGIKVIQIHFAKYFQCKNNNKRINAKIKNNHVNIMNTIFDIIYKNMKVKKLMDKLQEIKIINNHEDKLIDNVYFIMNLKRRAQIQYKALLQNISKEIQRYLSEDNGFMTQITQAFQSYLAVTCQNQVTLVQGYDEILSILSKTKQQKLSELLTKNALKIDSQINEQKQQIKHYKRLLNQNNQSIQLLITQQSLARRTGPFQPPLSSSSSSSPSPSPSQNPSPQFSQIQYLHNLSSQNQQKLSQQITNLMQILLDYDKMLIEIKREGRQFLQDKLRNIYDNFMRVFVIEVQDNRSMGHDLVRILEKLKQGESQGEGKERSQGEGIGEEEGVDKKDNGKLGVEWLRKKMEGQKGIKQSILDVYKKWTTPQIQLDIDQKSIDPDIREKWKKVCHFYNQLKI